MSEQTPGHLAELALRRAAGEVAKLGNANVARWRSDGMTSHMWTRGYGDGILAAQSIIAQLADQQEAHNARVAERGEQ